MSGYTAGCAEPALPRHQSERATSAQLFFFLLNDNQTRRNIEVQSISFPLSVVQGKA